MRIDNRPLEVIESDRLDVLTSSRWHGKRHELEEIRQELLQHHRCLKEGQSKIQKLERKLKRRKWFAFLGSFVRKKIDRIEDEILKRQAALVEVKDAIDWLHEQARLNFEGSDGATYEKLVEAFREVCMAERMWDVTEQKHGRTYRSTANASIDRHQTHWGFGRNEFIHPEWQALKLGNENGPDLHIYPTVIAAFYTPEKFALVDLSDATLEYSIVQFQEEEGVPADTRTVRHTWKYANKDGSRDRRFSNNYQIPVVLYGQLRFRSSTGINEMYQISDPRKASDFAEAFKEHRSTYMKA